MRNSTVPEGSVLGAFWLLVWTLGLGFRIWNLQTARQIVLSDLGN